MREGEGTCDFGELGDFVPRCAEERNDRESRSFCSRVMVVVVYREREISILRRWNYVIPFCSHVLAWMIKGSYIYFRI